MRLIILPARGNEDMASKFLNASEAFLPPQKRRLLSFCFGFRASLGLRFFLFLQLAFIDYQHMIGCITYCRCVFNDLVTCRNTLFYFIKVQSINPFFSLYFFNECYHFIIFLFSQRYSLPANSNVNFLASYEHLANCS